MRRISADAHHRVADGGSTAWSQASFGAACSVVSRGLISPSARVVAAKAVALLAGKPRLYVALGAVQWILCTARPTNEPNCRQAAIASVYKFSM
jgi:hypothetical protein